MKWAFGIFSVIIIISAIYGFKGGAGNASKNYQTVMRGR